MPVGKLRILTTRDDIADAAEPRTYNVTLCTNSTNCIEAILNFGLFRRDRQKPNATSHIQSR